MDFGERAKQPFFLKPAEKFLPESTIWAEPLHEFPSTIKMSLSDHVENLGTSRKT